MKGGGEKRKAEDLAECVRLFGMCLHAGVSVGALEYMCVISTCID